MEYANYPSTSQTANLGDENARNLYQNARNVYGNVVAEAPTTNEYIRRSSRQNLGKKPSRLGEWVDASSAMRAAGTKGLESEDLINLETDNEIVEEEDQQSVYSEVPSRHDSMRSHTSVASSVRRRNLEAEYQAAKAAADLEEEAEKKQLAREVEAERKHLDRQKKLIEMQLAAEKAKNEELLGNGSEFGSVRSLRSIPSNRTYEIANEKSTDENIIDDKLNVNVNNEDAKLSQILAKSFENFTDMMSKVLDSKTVEKNDTTNNRTDNDMKKFLARQTISKDLPHFHGESEEWPSFISRYKSSTLSCGFNDIENLDRLQKCLKGKAKETVQSMMYAPQNVNEIIETLELTFGRPQNVIKSLINKTKSMKCPTEEKPETIIEFSNAIRNLVSTMEALHYNKHLANPQLLEDLVGKLPANMKMEWGKRMILMKGEESLKDLSNWLKEIALAASYIQHITTHTEYKRNDEMKWKPPVKQMIEVTSVNKPENSREKTFNCLFCDDKKHDIKKCKKFESENVDEKWKFVTSKKVCYNCLQKGHYSTQCLKSKVCEINGCKGFHHKLLHNDKKPEKPDNFIHIKEKKHDVFLMICPVVLNGPNGKIKTYALLDGAATGTFIDVSMSKKLGLKGEKAELNLKWFNPTMMTDKSSSSVSLQISNADEQETFELKRVRTLKNMDLPCQTVDVNSLLKKWKHLEKFTDLSYVNAKPTILIGEDNSELIIARENVEGETGGPIVSKTKLGWIIHGNSTQHHYKDHPKFFFHSYEHNNDELHHLVKESFSIESLGVKIPTKVLQTKDDARAIKIIDESTRRVGERWETGLLWKDDHTKLPESKVYAFQRLKCMEKKMDKDEIFGKKYCEKIKEYEEKGYARKLSKEEASVETNKTWYLPHFGVINPNKPKLRFVFDGAAKSNGRSLNDYLLTGPDLLRSLIGVLFKFRHRDIGFTADIKEMFHQVQIKEDDRHAQRFLFRGMDRKRVPDIYEMTAMTFGATCSPCLAQAVKNKNAEEFRNEFPAAASAIIEKHYVDDYLDSSNDENEAIKLINDVIEVHRRGGFKICNWTCSSKEVLLQIPPEYRSMESKDCNFTSDLPNERVLGLQWNPNCDEFYFLCKFNKLDENLTNGNKIPTKRECLKITSSIYDPLGFLCPFTVKSKILLQEIWRSGIDWDQKINDELYEKWKIWISELQDITKIGIPRSYAIQIQKASSIQLHIFVDASQQAYSSVGFLRINVNDNIYIAFVMGKTRVAPLKFLDITRLELQAAVMGTRLGMTIREDHEIKIDKIIYWSDSEVVLNWIRSEKRKIVYVSHRIGEILETTDVSEWRWIDTKNNVADDATRDKNIRKFDSNCRWLKGPSFLTLPEHEWPTDNKLPEINQEELTTEQEFLNVVTTQQNVIEFAKYSSIMKLTRITAWVLRFLHNSRCKSKQNRRESELSVSEMSNAEKTLILLSQRESFRGEIICLEQKKEVPNSSKLKCLSPVLNDDGVVVMRSRIQKCNEIQEITKNPIVLDPKHPLTQMLIMYYHKKASHQGQEMIVNELRQRYWIMSIRTAVRSAWSKCNLCKILRTLPQAPEMGELPSCRVTRPPRPFTFTGLDYFGPMDVTIGRRHEKRYGVLFTCLSTRAIHLEIAASLSTNSAIMAIRRFIARRGNPQEIMSDNATNFIGANNELQTSLKDLDQTEIKNEMTNRGINWKYIPPSSPHMAGSWERMIRSVKTSLAITLKERAPKEEVLQTLFAEAENTINCHPLTHVSIDPDDKESLTPNHFLLGSSSASLPPGVFTDTDLHLRKQWRFSQRLADHFWKRWIHEYLPCLARRTKWYSKREPLKIGDIVIIADGNLERNMWPKGIIEKVYPGSDGQVRVADVKTQFGVFKRPVVKLCPLDIK